LQRLRQRFRVEEDHICERSGFCVSTLHCSLQHHWPEDSSCCERVTFWVTCGRSVETSPENCFQQCFQAWQRPWNVRMTSEGENVKIGDRT